MSHGEVILNQILYVESYLIVIRHREIQLKKQVKFNPRAGKIIQIFDPPSSSNDLCSMFHDIAYTVAQNTGRDSKDVKRKKLEADDKWLKCFKVRTPYDSLAYSAIKSKRTLG